MLLISMLQCNNAHWGKGQKNIRNTERPISKRIFFTLFKHKVEKM